MGISLSLSACSSVRYLAHLGSGQLRTLLDREKLTPEREGALSEAERAGLQTLRDARAFAESLGLARSTSYRHVIDRSGRGALRVVSAAPPDRLEPVTWWFPISGRVSYRGYFDDERADRFASSLAGRGYDTYTRTALLYSTLGWFDDPFPLSLLSWPRYEIADVVIHELVHETIYVPGDVDYNEGLASFIAQQATLEFLAEDPQQVGQAERGFADGRGFALLLDELATDLDAVYAGIDDPNLARRARAPVFERYQNSVFDSRSWQTERYAGFRDADLNNAYVLANRAYLRDVPCFERELAGLDGDLRSFIERHKRDPGHRDPDCAAAGASG